MKLGTLVKPLLVAGLFMAGSAMAAPSAQRVLTASPIDDIVERYPAMMAEGIREGVKRSQKLPPMVADTLGYVVRNSFSAADIEQKIVSNLEHNLSGKQLEAVEGWYKTPVARKISAAEIAASDPAAWGQIQARASELNKKYKGTDRARMFERFDRAARATESAVDTTIAVQLGLATAMAAFSSDSTNYDELKQKLGSQRSAIRGIVEQQVYDSYLHTYEKISAQEMGLYIDFLESEAGTAFSKTVTESIQQAITEPIESIGSQLARFLLPQK
ncbi:DUF2059 domain-containing protein [Marinobacter salexigens]|uniref:DUF2059 domain-containing protein n=1 Tax=Marinobacter salexigens TaxID=1925763 RepID=UPI000C29541B|nr:DUF2059 domain-containing protein [Marinobacter salexigens]